MNAMGHSSGEGKLIRPSEFRIAVESYASKYRHPDMKPFVIGDAVPIKKGWGSDGWKGLEEEHGVYAIYDERPQLLYIGKASSPATLMKRTGSHFIQGVPKDKERWKNYAPEFLQMVRTPFPWEGSSLEEY